MRGLIIILSEEIIAQLDGTSLCELLASLALRDEFSVGETDSPYWHCNACGGVLGDEELDGISLGFLNKLFSIEEPGSEDSTIKLVVIDIADEVLPLLTRVLLAHGAFPDGVVSENFLYNVRTRMNHKKSLYFYWQVNFTIHIVWDFS